MDFMNEILNYKPYIELIATLGTFITVLIAVYTLYEIRRQRESTYKPEIFLDTFCYFTVNSPFLVDHKLNKYRTSKYNEIDNDKTKLEHINVNYRLENLGFGFAKSIECKWEFDYQQAFKELIKVMPKEYKFNKLLDFHILLNEFDTNYQKSFKPNDLEMQRVDFIQPSANGENRKNLTMPKIIVDTYLYFLLFKYKLTENIGVNFNFEDFKNMPKIKMKLKYKDLSNKMYYKTLKINIECASSQINDDNSIEMNKEFAIFYVHVNE